MSDAAPDPALRAETSAPNFAEPSRKTGRSDPTPARPSRKTGRFEGDRPGPSSRSGRSDELREEHHDGEDLDALDVEAVLASANFPSAHPPDPDLPVPTPEHPGLGTRVGRRRRLMAIASSQEGCFTVAQARSVGLDRRARYHHLSYGNWRRTAAPSVFRFSHWPADPFEHLRAWLLWAGPSAALTSWSALEVLGRTTVGPHATVHLVVGPHPDWRTHGRRTVPDVESRPSPAARLHHVRDPELDDLCVAGMPVRPVEEALATALMTAEKGTIEVPLLHELIAGELANDDQARIRLLLTGRSMSATRLTELIYDPSVLARRPAALVHDDDISTAGPADAAEGA